MSHPIGRTLHSVLPLLHITSEITKEEAAQEVILGRVYSWTTDAWISLPLWPLADVALPGGNRYRDTLVTPNFLVVRYWTENFATKMTVHRRVPAAQYWPTEAEMEARLPELELLLVTDMYCHVGSDCDAEGADAAGHWNYAKRRYGIKRNPLSRIAFVCRVDPEGRARFPSMGEVFPRHVELYLGLADFMVGKRAGAQMTADSLYGTGQQIAADEKYAWCVEKYALLAQTTA